MNRTTKYTLLLLSSILFVYTFTKACLLSITWDEAYSYLEYVRKGIFIQDKLDMMSANNHLLNTWLGIFLVKCFGAHEWVLRIPSLLAHLLFLVYSAKLVSRFRTTWLIVSAFILLNFHPYLLDFFSLSRGYGLSMGLLMTSIYYLYVFHMEYKNKHALLSLFTGALSVLANYVTLNYVMALFAIIVMLQIYRVTQEPSLKAALWRNLLPVVAVFAVLLLIVVPMAFELKEVGALFFGGMGFWKDTIHSIVDRSFYELGYNYWFQRIAKAYIFLALAGASVFVYIKFQNKQLSPNKLFLISMLLILLMCCVSVILQNELLDTLYLMDRTALFLVVLFSVILVFFIQEWSAEQSRAAVIAYVSAVLMILHMGRAFNLNYVLEWKLNADTKEMLQDLEKIKTIPAERDNLSINIPLPFETDINFYRDIYNLTWINQVRRCAEINKLYDYYYLTKKELATLHPDSIEILKTYPVTQNALVKPKHPYRNVKVRINQELNFESEQDIHLAKDEEYSKGFICELKDSLLQTKRAVVVFDIEAKPLSLKTCDLGMVISMDGVKGIYVWDRVSTMDYMKDTEVWTKATFTCMVPEQAKAGDKLSLFIWNPNKQELLVKKMRFKWLEYQ